MQAVNVRKLCFRCRCSLLCQCLSQSCSWAAAVERARILFGHAVSPTLGLCYSGKLCLLP